ncbi:MAG: carboxypeptidase-like regulatory domain-containing protein, partial [Candidatus Omnitrophica bacterium]|nr:carboxypeptidase-like regulatory domain-containing protein [Candidatus Omnitrophota bacterium]
MKTIPLVFALIPWLSLNPPVTNLLRAQDAAGADTTGQSERDLEIDREHFRQIYKAIKGYRQDHQGELPDWLSELYPKYLTDTNLLISSMEQRTGQLGPHYIEDPKIHTSYNYEFNTTPASRFVGGEEAARMTMKQWKTKQTKTFGPVVPLVRFLWNYGSLNLAFSGDIYESQIGWETDPRTLALVQKLREAGRLKTEQPGKFMPVTVSESETEKPIANVEVRLEIQDEYGWQPLQVLSTDDRGQCQAAMSDRKILQFKASVRKTGYVSIVDSFTDSAEMPTNLTLRLLKAKAVGGVVQDAQQKPVAGSSVAILGYNETVTTDANGRWAYAGVPQNSEQFAIEVTHPDYHPEHASSEGTNVVVTMTPLFQVKGTVKDAATGKPINDFNVTYGMAVERSVEWNRRLVYRARGGTFSLRFPEESPDYLKVEAVGYWPAYSRRLDKEKERDLDFALARGTFLRGHVVGANDQPAAYAQVALLTESSTALLGHASFVPRVCSITRADREGRFTFLSDPEACALVAASQDGFAEASVETLTEWPKLTLKPWSKLDAALHPAKGSTGENTLLIVSPDAMLPQLYRGPFIGNLALDFNTFVREAPEQEQTFQFDFVPPGKRVVWRALRIDEQLSEQPENAGFVGIHFTARPGETTLLNLGGHPGN